MRSKADAHSDEAKEAMGDIRRATHDRVESFVRPRSSLSVVFKDVINLVESQNDPNAGGREMCLRGRLEKPYFRVFWFNARQNWSVATQWQAPWSKVGLAPCICQSAWCCGEYSIR
jgi:hypothetical protein